MFIWDSGIRVKSKAMGYILQKQDKNTKVIFITFWNTAKVKNSFQTVTISKELLSKENLKDLVYINGKMELLIKDNLKKVLERVKEK